MPIIQPKLEISEELLRKYERGEIDIRGIAVDTPTQRIVKHLKRINKAVGKKEPDAVAKTSAGISRAEMAARYIITSIPPELIANTVYDVVQLVQMHHKWKAEEMEFAIQNFRGSINFYCLAIQGQFLSSETIDDLSGSINWLQKKMGKNPVPFLASDEFNLLVDIICEHTKNLEKANNIIYFEDYTDTENQDCLLKLQKAIKRQKEVFKKAA